MVTLFYWEGDGVMGGKQTNELIETHVKRMDDVIVSDVPTARQALAHATAAVAAINQGLIPPQSYESIGDLDPVEEIVNKLEGWIRCILDKLGLIVEKLGEGVTFSLSVGTSISVTINFPANQAVPAKSKEPGVSMSQGN
jgi:ethanolamine ammonia-lyase large subunit